MLVRTLYLSALTAGFSAKLAFQKAISKAIRFLCFLLQANGMRSGVVPSAQK